MTAGNDLRVVELRQYRLHPGARERLIELFDAELLEPQEAAGMTILGQFRDLDRPDRFVWLRGFDGMAARRRALEAFYGGSTWALHREAANATMIDSDDVLLLRPLRTSPSFSLPADRSELREGHRPPVIATIHHLSEPPGRWADDLPWRRGNGLVWVQTERSENNYPALPVREGEEVLVSVGAQSTADLLRNVGGARAVRTEILRLEPTMRSLLR